jgi:hypothetical protein
MRALTGLLVLAALAAAPSPAHAQEEPLCRFNVTYDEALQRTLSPYLQPIAATGTTVATGGEAGDAARSVLGAQFGMLWLDHTRGGWSVAFSPGTHDATSARAAIRDYLAARLDPATVVYLDSTLHLLPTPYSRAELDAVMAQLAPVVAPLGISTIGCQWSDGLRVEISLGPAETPELRAQIDAALAPFGDTVRVRFGINFAGTTLDALVPATTIQQRPTPKVREYVSLPRTSRCARTVGARPKPGLDVKRIRLQIGRRVSAGAGPRLKLKARRSTVKVTVTLTDGTRVFEDLTYRRCR